MKRFDRIYVEITNSCNLNCKFCDKTTREIRFMSLDEFQIVVNKIKDYTNIIALHVKGEPLLHPELNKILKVCFDANIKINITTNAILLGKNSSILAESNAVRQLNLSMHALVQNGLKIEKNVNNIFLELEKIRSKNKNIIFSYRLWNVKSINENDINNTILKMLGEKYNISNILERSKTEKFIELDKNIFLNQDIQFEWPSMEKDVICKSGNCYGLKKQLGILSNGDVVPCCLDQNGDIKLGNILNENLNEILESERAKNIVKGFNERKLIEELCKRCGFVNSRLK
jgi:radical SAM protein with 4Fe4S-binding SPASM domain